MPSAPGIARVHGRHLSEYCATIFHSNWSARNVLKISSIISAGDAELHRARGGAAAGIRRCGRGRGGVWGEAGMAPHL
eukprot:scaffold3936_cov128-Isochrysis_galbana.AAC.6